MAYATPLLRMWPPAHAADTQAQTTNYYTCFPNKDQQRVRHTNKVNLMTRIATLEYAQYPGRVSSPHGPCGGFLMPARLTDSSSGPAAMGVPAVTSLASVRQSACGRWRMLVPPCNQVLPRASPYACP